MKYFEYGKENKELVVVLHGAGVSYKGAEPTVNILARKYHVILVGYDGFNPSEPETEFVSVQYEARKFGDYILENHNWHIDILYGLSYGGKILMEVLSDKRLTITTTIADGMSLKDYPNLKSKIGKIFSVSSLLDCFMRLWEIRECFVLNFYVRLREGQLKKQTGFYIGMQLGKVGRIRIIA